MISEAISKVQELATNAMKLVDLDIGNSAVSLYDRRGEVVKIDLPISERKHVVKTIESFGKALSQYKREASSVWVSLKSVCAVLDDGDGDHRAHTVWLPVSPSNCFETLGRQTWVTQERLIDILRHDLAGVTITPENTLSVLRNLKFATQSEQTGAFTNTSAKMGKSVAAQVTGEADIPETVSVEFHPFPALSEEVEGAEVIVYCTLFTKPGEGKLWLSPRPGELEHAETKATEHLTSAIEGVVGDVPVFVGTP